ncbi:hypothetical protein AOQ84DRAFT_300129, partial [Glonium stellatum]
FPKTKKWVLRNFTTREFVRADAVALKPDFIAGPRIKGLGFGELVLSRICWSSQVDTSVSEEVTLHKGVWAGHRFDIVTTKKLQAESEDEGAGKWLDVSDEVTKEMEAVWKSECGEEWVREICD